MRTNFDNISFVNISKTGGSILKKKVMLAAAMLLMVGGLSACGPNKEKILQKTIDSQSKIKSGELDSNVSVIAKADGYSKKILMDLDVTFTKDPSASKVETVISKGGSKTRFTAMCDEKNVYLKVPYASKWYRQSITKTGKHNLISKDVTNTPSEYLNMMKDNDVDMDVKEKGNEYILTFDAGKKFTKKLKREILEQYMSSASTTASSVTYGDLKKSDFKNFKYRINVDKKTYLPKTYKINFAINAKDGGDTATVSESLTGKYKNVNKVNALKMPTNYVDLSH